MYIRLNTSRQLLRLNVTIAFQVSTLTSNELCTNRRVLFVMAEEKLWGAFGKRRLLIGKLLWLYSHLN